MEDNYKALRLCVISFVVLMTVVAGGCNVSDSLLYIYGYCPTTVAGARYVQFTKCELLK